MQQLTHLALAKLPADGSHSFTYTPDTATRQAMAERLGLLEIRKLRAELTLSPRRKRDWHLEANWGGTFLQPCVVTLAPVTTRIDRTDTLLFTTHMPEVTEAETEMPEDDTLEPLRDSVEIAPLIEEMISLALPAYPRAGNAELGEAIYAEPGVAAMTDEEAKPFAGLAALKAKLEKDAE